MYKIVLPWQHRDYRTITALSLGLRPRESGQLSTIIPQNHGITITYMDTNTENFTPACGVTTITHLQHLLALGVLLFEDGISSLCGWTVHFTSFVKQISSFRVNFGVTVQTEQGHDSDWRDFSTIVRREESLAAWQILDSQ